jgi:hypothetical protein
MKCGPVSCVVLRQVAILQAWVDTHTTCVPSQGPGLQKPGHHPVGQALLFFSFFFLLVGLGFELGSKQALYRLSHTSSPFCSGYFGDGLS